MDFTDLNLQDCVATQLRCGNIFSKNHFITYFPRNMLVKKFENWSIFGEDIAKSLRLTFGPPYISRY